MRRQNHRTKPGMIFQKAYKSLTNHASRTDDADFELFIVLTPLFLIAILFFHPKNGDRKKAFSFDENLYLHRMRFGKTSCKPPQVAL